MRIAPKFYPNKADDIHCIQASVLSTINSLENSLDWEEVDRLTRFDPALWTWMVPAAAVISRFAEGVTLKTVFDYPRFIESGEAYLAERWHPEKLAVQRRFSSPNFSKEIEAATEFSKGGNFEKVANFDPQGLFEDLKRNLVIALVNAPAMNGEAGYSSHAVVIYGASEVGGWLFLHDPGLPPRKSQRIKASSFWRAFTEEIILVPHARIPFGATYNANDSCYCGSGKKFKKCYDTHPI